jgi:purine-binding chemotaxis protein CheW
LLGFSEIGANANGRIVVARCGDALVGLLVDGIRAIYRAPLSAIDAVPAVLSRANGEAEIASICRADGGLRLVSILSPERLFRSQRMARGPSAVTPRAPDRKSTDVQPASTQRFVVFRLGEEHYGLPVGAVEEVVRAPDTLTRVPCAPAFIEGVMNLRGKVLPVIDQRRRFESGSAGGGGRIVVVRLDDARVGFVVDGVSEVVSASSDQISAAPAHGDDRTEVFDQVLHGVKTGQMILLINPRGLLDRAERALLAQMDQANAASGAA